MSVVLAQQASFSDRVQVDVTTNFYRVRGLQLAYHVYGNLNKPIVICIHGFLDHGRSFDAVASMLAKDFCVVAPDLRGHGQSDWIGNGGYYYFFDYLEDLMSLIEILTEDHGLAPTPIYILGHSLGGNIAAYVTALLNRQRSKNDIQTPFADVQALVLLEGMGLKFASLGQMLPRVDRWMTSLRQKEIRGDVQERRQKRKPMDGLESAALRLCKANPRLSKDVALGLAKTATEEMNGKYFWRFDPLHKSPSVTSYLQEETVPVWQSIDVPTLSIYGEFGFLLEDLEQRHANIRTLNRTIVNGASHNLHHERPDVVAELALAHFSDLI